LNPVSQILFPKRTNRRSLVKRYLMSR